MRKGDQKRTIQSNFRKKKTNEDTVYETHVLCENNIKMELNLMGM
jgi:hypothetical protein